MQGILIRRTFYWRRCLSHVTVYTAKHVQLQVFGVLRPVSNYDYLRAFRTCSNDESFQALLILWSAAEPQVRYFVLPMPWCSPSFGSPLILISPSSNFVYVYRTLACKLSKRLWCAQVRTGANPDGADVQTCCLTSTGLSTRTYSGTLRVWVRWTGLFVFVLRR